LHPQVEEQQDASRSPKKHVEEKNLHMRNISDSNEGFDNYAFNTTNPLTGVRTTKVSIEPIRTGLTPKTTTNAKLNEEFIDSGIPQKLGLMRSKSKVLHSPSSKKS